MSTEILLIIDNREHELHNLIECAIPEQLDIGDIIYRNAETNEILLIIERKTVSDLAASICDGRHREQKMRLLGSGISLDKIMYIIEGNVETVKNLPSSTLIGSIINTMLRDGIKVYKTNSTKETSIFLLRMLEKLNKEHEMFWKYNENKTITSVDYSSSLKTSKKANMTPEVWFITTLSLIPQITPKIAGEIVKVYPSINELLSEYNSLDNDILRKKLLEDITYPITGGKTRRIGTKISEKVYNFFYGQCDEK